MLVAPVAHWFVSLTLRANWHSGDFCSQHSTAEHELSIHSCAAEFNRGTFRLQRNHRNSVNDRSVEIVQNRSESRINAQYRSGDLDVGEAGPADVGDAAGSLSSGGAPIAGTAVSGSGVVASVSLSTCTETKVSWRSIDRNSCTCSSGLSGLGCSATDVSSTLSDLTSSSKTTSSVGI